MTSSPASRPAQLIVALDVPSVSDLPGTLDRIGDAADFYKVGLELFCASGPAALEPLTERGARVFLDLKLHDIPRTVERAVRAAARHRAALATVHAAGGRAMLEAAANAAREAGPDGPALLAVTVLTSLGRDDLTELGLRRTPRDQVLAMAELALSAGIDGVVCSPREAAALRDRFGPDPLLVTPGIRPAGGQRGDQKRVATPADAVRAGATHLVVGRPILEAPDPGSAARQIRAEMAAAPVR